MSKGVHGDNRPDRTTSGAVYALFSANLGYVSKVLPQGLRVEAKGSLLAVGYVWSSPAIGNRRGRRNKCEGGYEYFIARSDPRKAQRSMQCCRTIDNRDRVLGTCVRREF